MRWLLLIIVVAIVIASLTPIARKECEAKGGTMVYAGKMMWCEVEK